VRAGGREARGSISVGWGIYLIFTYISSWQQVATTTTTLEE